VVLEIRDKPTIKDRKLLQCRKVKTRQSESRDQEEKLDSEQDGEEIAKKRAIQGRSRLTVNMLNKDFPEVVACGGKAIRFCTLEKCCIDTAEGKRVIKKGQRIPQALRSRTEKYLKELEERGVIRRSSSEWRNPIRALPKGDDKVRLVSNLMALNDLTEKDPYALESIREVTSAAQGATIFSVLDLKEGFYHIEVEEKDKFKTAFEVDGRVYEWNGMVMGFKNAPQIMQRVMNRIFDDMRRKGVMVYMDDILVYGATVKEHDALLIEVFKRLKANNMRINMEKLQLGLPEVKLLGVMIDGKAQTPVEIKKNEALAYPRPESIKDVRRFLGLAGWFRNFIKDFSVITSELAESVSRKEWTWTEGMELEFQNLKLELRGMKKLLLPNYANTFLLRTDASSVGMGAVLMQQCSEEEWLPVQWASKKFTPTECRYGISEKEMYAVYWGILKFEYELRGKRFLLETDHKALVEIRRKPVFENDRINRWIEHIQEFDFEVRYKKGEEIGVPDALSRLYEEKNLEANEKKSKISKEKAAREQRHIESENGKTIWTFDDGQKREVPEESTREKMVVEVHERQNHRSMEAVYYEIKRKYYWPGIKEFIRGTLKKCAICMENNRKTSGGCDFVETREPWEKMALDLIDMRSEGKYVLVGIDYFTRWAQAQVIESKETETVIEVVRKWMAGREKPGELITDNGKEFVSRKFEEMCTEKGVAHRKVSVESHRSNGRVERLIGTIREGLVKLKNGSLKEKIARIIGEYNKTYHTALRCTPEEAFKTDEGMMLWQNSRDGEYAKKFKKGFRETFEENEKIVMSKIENINSDAKVKKGRFIREGRIVAKCQGDSYLVKTKEGKYIKQRHSGLKKDVRLNTV